MINPIDTPEIKSDEQFWVDIPEDYESRPISMKPFVHLFKFYAIFLTITILLVPILVIGIALGPGFSIAYILFICLVMSYSLYLRRQTKAEIKEKEHIQAQASEYAKADTIGSGIHVAGHPLLERDFPVVFALKNDELAIHSYQSQIPKDVIKISNIKAVYTVVYDDERVPYIDVIDSTAQALQMTIVHKGKDYSCLFRSFRKVRAIDWYHELQRAKFH